MRTPLFALLATLALTTGGCKTLGDNPITGSISSSAAPQATTMEGWRAVVEKWRPAFDKNPQDANAAINLGHALRMLHQSSQAVAVLQTAAVKNLRNKALLGEYGRALAENGSLDQALDVLGQAHTPDRPDWRILMAQGAVLDQLERGEEARKYYETALRIMPEEPSILSNYGLSYALSGDLTNAEAVLRRAYANPRADMRVRQNLALVLALGGKIDEAQRVASQDLSPQEAAQNMAYLRSMVSQGNNWKKLKQLDRGGAPAAQQG